jgi:uncharacterized protein
MSGWRARRDALALALDRAASSRRFDQDGRLHVTGATLTMAAVNDYAATEIPNWQQLGLDASRTYALFRPPEELAAAAASFCGVPLLIRHVEVDSLDHHPEAIAGAVGTDPEFDGEFLRGTIVVWSNDGIRGIVDGSRASLSAGYRYTATLERGSFKGRRYDLVMRSIAGNHVSLVASGRIGRSAVIGDSAVPRCSREAVRAAALRLVPELARIRIGP